ncbi:MAG: hypothetical protein ACFKPT_00835 [Gloeotrichia echinulata GP01]
MTNMTEDIMCPESFDGRMIKEIGKFSQWEGIGGTVIYERNPP